jgi:hypothetical protein
MAIISENDLQVGHFVTNSTVECGGFRAILLILSDQLSTDDVPLFSLEWAIKLSGSVLCT